MTKYCGSNFRIAVEEPEGSGTYVVISGDRSLSVTTNNEAVDVTDKDVMPNRSLIACGVNSQSISLSGVMSDGNPLNIVLVQAITGAIRKYQVSNEVGVVYEGFFLVTTFERGGDHNGAETLSVSLEGTSEPGGSQPPYLDADLLWLAESFEDTPTWIDEKEGDEFVLTPASTAPMASAIYGGYPAVVASSFGADETFAEIFAANSTVMNTYNGQPRSGYYVINTDSFGSGFGYTVVGETNSSLQNYFSSSSYRWIDYTSPGGQEDIWLVFGYAYDGTNFDYRIHAFPEQTAVRSIGWASMKLQFHDSNLPFQGRFNCLAFFGGVAHDAATRASIMDSLAQRVGYPEGTIT